MQKHSLPNLLEQNVFGLNKYDSLCVLWFALLMCVCVEIFRLPARARLMSAAVAHAFSAIKYLCTHARREMF